MKKNTFIINNGFSLLEITIVLIIISILLSAVVPVLSRAYLEKAANKTALDISTIEEAARKFYIDNNQWPNATSVDVTPMAVLQDPANGYLPNASQWNAINPFGASAATPANYSYSILQFPINPSLLTVCTLVPSDAQNIILNSLPSSYIDSTGGPTNGDVCSSVSVPGASSVLPAGSIIAWPTTTAPAGFLWCNGQAISRTTYAGLFAVIGTTYGIGDGSTTFNLPDIMGRTVVGQDAMGGASAVNRITQWGATPSTMGGTFGEDAHTLKVAEIPPLAVSIPVLQAHWGASYDGFIFVNLNQWPPQSYLNFNTNGGGGAHNVVQPSIALGYIIKY